METRSIRFDILDHGYLELVDHWGSDEAVIRAARMSTDKGFLGWGPVQKFTCPTHGAVECYHVGKTTDGEWIHLNCSAVCDVDEKPGDEKLLRYLWENEHSTPFEFGGVTIEVQAPIAVFREWHRHRVPFGYSELSARYTPMPDMNYVPTVERIVEGSKQTKNRQASSVAGECSKSQAEYWITALYELYQQAQHVYELGLEQGVPKELARLCVPVGRYSRMRATGNLRGWLNFCRLRMAETAQWEIRQFANAVGELLQEKFPRTWELYQSPTPKERRIAELEAAIREIKSMSVTVGYDSGHTGISEVCERVLKS